MEKFHSRISYSGLLLTGFCRCCIKISRFQKRDDFTWPSVWTILYCIFWTTYFIQFICCTSLSCLFHGCYCWESCLSVKDVRQMLSWNSTNTWIYVSTLSIVSKIWFEKCICLWNSANLSSFIVVILVFHWSLLVCIWILIELQLTLCYWI